MLAAGGIGTISDSQPWIIIGEFKDVVNRDSILSSTELMEQQDVEKKEIRKSLANAEDRADPRSQDHDLTAVYVYRFLDRVTSTPASLQLVDDDPAHSSCNLVTRHDTSRRPANAQARPAQEIR